MYSVVVPLQDYQRFIDVCLPSLELHLEWSRLRHVVVIVPKGHLEAVRDALNGHVHKARFKVVSLEKLLPFDKMYHFYMHTMVRLMAAKAVQSHYYLIIDDDTVLVRSFGTILFLQIQQVSSNYLNLF